jgi:glycerol-3-phosphate dehydrogenase (NAD(P)+)
MRKLIAVLGAGNMGTAVAKVLAENGNVVRIWNWEGDHAPLQQIEECGENKKYLPGFKLSKEVIACYKIEDALRGAEIVFFVVPSGVMEHTISFAARSIKHNAILVDVSKGIEPHSLRLIPYVIAKHVRPSLRKNIVTISGPAIAMQMARRQYTAMNIASKNRQAIKKVVEVFVNGFIKLVPTSDVIGVEIGGSFKNAYTIATGMCDGLGLGLNTKAALLTIALGEISELIKVAGGRRHTAYELAGVGDLIGTALCPDSRNRTFGEYLGKGLTSAQALKKVKQTVEGVDAIHCLLHLAHKYMMSVPFAEMIGKCVFSKSDPRNIFKEYLRLKIK